MTLMDDMILVKGTTEWDQKDLKLPSLAVVPPTVYEKFHQRHNFAVIRRTEGTIAQDLLLIVKLARGEPDMAENELRLTQTARTSLGMPGHLNNGPIWRSGISLHKLHIPLKHQLFSVATNIVGRRFALLRTAYPETKDIEKNYCLIPENDLTALGVQTGGRVVLFGLRSDGEHFRLCRNSLQAMGMDVDTVDRRRALEEDQSHLGLDALYCSPAHLLDMNTPDLGHCLIDRGARVSLGLTIMSPVLVRRDTRSALGQQFEELGIVLLVAILGLGPILTPIAAQFDIPQIVSNIMILLLSVLVSLVGVTVKLRSTLR